MHRTILLTLAICSGYGNAYIRYTIIGPKSVQSNTTFPISILCENATSDVKVDVTVRPYESPKWAWGNGSYPGQFMFPKSFTLKLNQLTRLEIDIPDLSQYPDTGNRLGLSINGSDSTDTFYRSYEWSIGVRQPAPVDDKPLAFIQTDQPLYKAKDTVGFRIVTVNRQLHPVRIPLTVQILDPQNNIVKQYSNISDTAVTGYFSGDLLLSSEPLLGSWTIEARTSVSQNVIGKKQFSVDEYVLPRFDVKILSLPTYVTPSDTVLTFSIEANYTFGEPVKGQLDAVWKRSWLYYEKTTGRNISVNDFNGRSVVTLNITNAVHAYGDYDSDDKLMVSVNFTETLTGQSKVVTASIPIRTRAYKVEILDNAGTFIPGFPYAFRARVSDLDGRPLSPSTKPIKIGYTLYDKRDKHRAKRIYLRSNFSSLDLANSMDLMGGTRVIHTKLRRLNRPRSDDQPYNEVLTLPVPPNGLVDVIVPITNDTRRIEVKVKYMDDSTTFTTMGRESPSGSFLDIKPLTPDMRKGKTVTFGVNMTTRTNETIQLILQSTSNVSFLWTNSTSEPGRSISISVPLSDFFGSNGRLIAYYVRDDGEFVGNIFIISVSSLTTINEVNISAEAKSGLGYVQPNEEAVFKAKTSPSSFVAFLAVDESLLLLKTGNDISTEEINKAVGNVKPKPEQSDTYSVDDIFKKNPSESDLFILTNNVFPSSREGPEIYYSAMFSNALFDFVGGASPGRFPSSFTKNEDSANNLQPPAKNRKDFRQSFLFETATSNADGTAEIQSKVPDAVTTWKITAFSLSNTSGLGLTQIPAKLKVFQPFFVVLNLPFSIVRYENLTAEVLVFNYMSQQQEVTVQLQIRNPDNTTSELKQNITAKPGDGVTATFNVIPQQIGDLRLKVTARSAFAADQLEKTLPVKPEGVKQYYSRPVFVDLRQSSNLELPLTLPSDPAGKVAGSDKVEIKVVGDILGAAMNNLDKLIRLPTGCGEQNMAITTPNLVVAKYLKQLNQLSETQRSKLVSNMQLGYQRELTYRHTDNSYSAWGKADPIGSTWLTAYVARVFSEATEFVPIIEDDVVQSAVRFLIHQQKEGGSFEEKGKVIDKQHQGGASAGVALTAFTLLSILQYQESGNDSTNQLAASKDNATAFLESRLPTLTNDSYTLAITAYALAKTKSGKSALALDLLEQKMIKNTSAAYWATVASLSDQGADVEHSYPTNAKDVEATAYALLAFLANNKFASSLPIVSWLISKQNAEGGFVSTQDTVVGLTALAEFAKAFINPPSMQIDINYDQNKKNVSLTPDSSVVLQTVELQNKPKSVTLKAQGRGLAITYLSWTYYVAKPAEDVAFDLDVTKTTSNADLRMSICSRYVREGKSSMAVIEINTLSGYQFDEDEIRKLVKSVRTLRKTEIENKETKLNLYFDQLEESPTCFKITMYRIYKVADIKDQSIVVYDYYNPKERRTVSYSLS
ncbi:CD109 antigen-like isoform X2 [Paramacrobiotus metropolitanus]|uniref:CD109 antigen-like isoform X2 n=1 Tax=Paramacrobiotus metropolitanus TaxID=2943436 RepID=UPI0024460E5F|nr:CD109 antigen-like isoform X2 [Paramacrobiotus metropolitanus]